MPTRYADIAIPNVPRDTLTYAVPDGLVNSILPGQRVSVSLNRRLASGFVVRVHEIAPEFTVKQIQQILDPKPVISASMMDLCVWTGRYYHCSLGVALKAALPQGMDIDTEQIISLKNNDPDLIRKAVGRSLVRQQIVDMLVTGEVMSEETLRFSLGLQTISAQIRHLLMEGVIGVESVLERPRVRAKTVLAVRMLPPWNKRDKLRELMDIMEKRAPKQVNVLVMLDRCHRTGRPTVPMAELVQLAQTGNQQVRVLEEKEIVEILEEEVTREPFFSYEEKLKNIRLTSEQESALGSITSWMAEGNGYGTFLLHGVTASGKTQVYIEAIRHVLDTGRNALVLVPEISLTPQLVFRFRSAFGSDVTVLHSRMSLGERYDSWRHTLDGRFRIVVGVRSAVFAPLANTGLIVVDEEHESSYKQSDMIPRYHARDVAVMRGRIENCAVLLGSATPSAESYQNTRTKKYRLIEMPSRIDGAELPNITPVDMSLARRMNTVKGALSSELLEALKNRAERGEGSILLLNRRGFAPHLECDDCGFVEECPNCSISLTYHKDKDLLRCHYCGSTGRLPVYCPNCGGEKLDLVGTGTQRIEEDLQAALAGIRILRMDFDTTRRKGSHDLILSSFAAGEADVLLGTQMVAKGLDFERVTLVGVISAEQSLLFPDFRSAERTFQILTQVSGRSGRGKHRGEVLIQAMRPDHPVFRKVYDHDYTGFISEEIRSRENLFYPPFARLVLLTFSGSQEKKVADTAGAWYAVMRRHADFFRHHEPQPALLKKINSRYRYHILLRVQKQKDPDGSLLFSVLRTVSESSLRKPGSRSVRIDIDVDPQSFV